MGSMQYKTRASKTPQNQPRVSQRLVEAIQKADIISISLHHKYSSKTDKDINKKLRIDWVLHLPDMLSII